MSQSVRWIVTVLILIIVLGIGMPVCADPTGMWHIETVDSAGVTGDMNSLAIDSEGLPQIAYHSDLPSSDLRYAKFDGTLWHIQTVDPRWSTGWYPSLQLDKDDNPHIVYYEHDNDTLLYVVGQDHLWRYWEPLSPYIGKDTGMYAHLALDQNGNPRISCIDYYMGDYNKLVYVWNDSEYDAWDYEVLENGDLASNDLALDHSDHPHIVYTSDTGLNYTWSDGNSWHTETVLPEASSPELALDSNDHPHICAASGNRALLYHVYSNGSSWNIEVVDGPYTWTNTITSCSIAIDSNDNPHISYRVADDHRLMYAVKKPTGWERTILDSFKYGVFMGDTSIALDAHDSPHISYYDGENYDLKYAWLAPPSPSPTVMNISPDHAVSFSTVHITDLKGTGFFESTTLPEIRLTTYCPSYPCVIQTPIVATNVTIVSAARITCDFAIPFSSDWVGPYNVVVTNPDGQQGKLVNGFTVTPIPQLSPLPGIANLPTDPDSDGLYEDLNANSRKDFSDVVLMFNQMQWIAANEPVSAFDFNGNGRIDFNDIVRLFGEI